MDPIKIPTNKVQTTGWIEHLLTIYYALGKEVNKERSWKGGWLKRMKSKNSEEQSTSELALDTIPSRSADWESSMNTRQAILWASHTLLS